jgi:hypothetical protein
MGQEDPNCADERKNKRLMHHSILPNTFDPSQIMKVAPPEGRQVVLAYVKISLAHHQQRRSRPCPARSRS